MPPGQECLESLTQELEHPCDFPESDPSKTAVVRLRRHCSQHGWTCPQLAIFLHYGPRSPTRVCKPIVILKSSAMKR